jgi:hypothetical protein
MIIIQHMIEHTRQHQLRPEEPEDGGHALDEHTWALCAGHPGSTCLGTVTPSTQESQYLHVRILEAGAGAVPVAIGEPLINFFQYIK